VSRTARLALLLLAATAACGPSISAVYEGNVRFEHCYRLDMDPQIASTHRQICWKEWTARYTYGQTRDRLEYARRRMRALAAGEQVQAELQLDQDAGAGAPPEAPIPTSVHKPPPPTSTPPPVATADAGESLEGGAAEASPTPPAFDCTRECRDSWRTCISVCGPDAGAKLQKCKVCDSDYRRCVQRCLK